ncbi:hypothetical protein GHA01_31310 [Novacetimonas hansenii]|uniref:Uncharacterized protein n=1 Tax=Novacetimonas hansenii TaxID=436 RepID=A0ABQ0SKM1_NOVHA|nr:hypothetical protein Gaha_0069_004 [Novacetimonas hansenii JCM 7643]GBQ55733.1 hypothetical protein AA0243_0998 [Novacetimonas hansenii NRIC 0243]GEC65282.1 hypothetical protein GHA01_31310 [Novacetimonas hansenii]
MGKVHGTSPKTKNTCTMSRVTGLQRGGKVSGNINTGRGGGGYNISWKNSQPNQK